MELKVHRRVVRPEERFKRVEKNFNASSFLASSEIQIYLENAK